MGIISCGVNNKYGHPHEETLSILRDAGVDVYRTDLLGTITVSSDGQNYTTICSTVSMSVSYTHLRRKPAHELSGGHFFFFEVFHDAFSFC